MIVDEYASPENDYAFSKTVVPVNMAEQNDSSKNQSWSATDRKKIVNLLLGGFEGKLTTEKWAKLRRESSHHTALRDIQDLIGKGILKQEKGGGRSEEPLRSCTPPDKTDVSARDAKIVDPSQQCSVGFRINVQKFEAHSHLRFRHPDHCEHL